MYIDLLFFADFLLDCIVLCGTKWMVSAPVSVQRLILAAVLGASQSTGYTVFCNMLGKRGAPWGSMVWGLAVCALMVWVGFRPRGKEVWMRTVLVTYANGFLLGGSMRWLEAQHLQWPVQGLLCAAAAGCLGGIWCTEKLRKKSQRKCQVHLLFNGQTVDAEALVDSGNGLRMADGRRVSVVGETLVYSCFTAEQRREFERLRAEGADPNADQGKRTENFRVLTYESVGCAKGYLLVVEITSMRVETAYGDRILIHPWIGIAFQEQWKSQTQMIMHPESIFGRNC